MLCLPWHPPPLRPRLTRDTPALGALRSFVAVLAAVSPYRSPLSTTWAAVASAAKALALFAHVMLVPHVVQYDKETMELVGWTLVVGWLVTFLLLAALQVRSAVAVGCRVWQAGCPCARTAHPPPRPRSIRTTGVQVPGLLPCLPQLYPGSRCEPARDARAQGRRERQVCQGA